MHKFVNAYVELLIVDHNKKLPYMHQNLSCQIDWHVCRSQVLCTTMNVAKRICAKMFAVLISITGLAFTPPRVKKNKKTTNILQWLEMLEFFIHVVLLWTATGSRCWTLLQGTIVELDCQTDICWSSFVVLIHLLGDCEKLIQIHQLMHLLYQLHNTCAHSNRPLLSLCFQCFKS